MSDQQDSLWGYAGGYGGWQAYGGDSYGRQNWHWRYSRLGFWLALHPFVNAADHKAFESETAVPEAKSKTRVEINLVAETYSFSKAETSGEVLGVPATGERQVELAG
jgi:hypothetical protein